MPVGVGCASAIRMGAVRLMWLGDGADSFDRGLIDAQVFTFSNRDDFHDDFLFNDAVDDSDSLLRRVEFVIPGEVEACSIPQGLAEER